MKKGENAKINAQILMIFLYPKIRLNRVATRTANEAGIIAQSMMTEFVRVVIYVPLFLRYE